MQFKSFVIPVADSAKLEAEMNAFLRSHKIITLTKEFILNGENSAWSILAEYIDDSITDEKLKAAVDYKEALSKEDFALFSYLRDERKKIADAQKIPVYVIFTNAQLAEIAEKKPETQAALAEIQGIGKGKCEKYGELLLTALKNFKNHEAAQ